MLVDPSIENDWKEHLEIDRVKEPFPRDYSSREEELIRAKAINLRHYITVNTLAMRNRQPNHVSVYSDWETHNHIAHSLFFDIEGQDILKTSLFVSKFIENGKAFNPFVIYTGGRGYHLLFPIPSTPILDLKRANLTLLDLIGDGLDIDAYVDRQPLGNWRMMTVVPHTYHRKTGFETQIIQQGSVTYASTELAEFIASKHLISASSSPLPPSLGSLLPQGIVEESKGMPLCVSSIITKIGSTGESTHYERVHVASWMMKAGFGDEEIVAIFKMAKDYKPEITSYQVEYLRQRNYKCLGCQKAMTLGMCPVPATGCPYVPSLNWHF